jgi:hypothetical protein
MKCFIEVLRGKLEGIRIRNDFFREGVVVKSVLTELEKQSQAFGSVNSLVRTRMTQRVLVLIFKGKRPGG